MQTLEEQTSRPHEIASCDKQVSGWLLLTWWFIWHDGRYYTDLP